MKRITIVLLVLIFGLCLTTNALAGTKEAAKKNVDEVVTAINGGKDAKSINANDYDPYVFVFQEDGTMFVHPSLVGKSLKEAAPPVYEAIVKGVNEGKDMVDYMWKGAMKHSYVKKTDSGLIVGSGYSK
ncbi:MAG TPA: cache domain-containing protein [Desulfopila sp.]|nr:cache domain-containing protein [Desulfopila sp.]